MGVEQKGMIEIAYHNMITLPNPLRESNSSCHPGFQVLRSLSMGRRDEGGEPHGDGLLPNGLEVCKILILTDFQYLDFQYLAQGISEHIWKWKKNGSNNSKETTRCQQ